MIRVGQIGIGHNHASAKMRTVRKLNDLYEVVGVSESNPDWIEKRGNDPMYQGITFMDEDELIEKCDLLLIETDVWNLNDTAIKALKAGKHIHLDKPGCEDYKEFEKMVNIARKSNLVLQMGYMYRYNPAIRKLFDMVKDGEVGEILSVNAEMSTRHSAEYRKWLEHFKGGTMYIFGSHLLDLIILMLGEPKNVTSFLKHTGLDGNDSADNDLAVLEYEKSIAKIYTSSNECNGWGRRQFTVCGSKATVSIEPIEVPCIMKVAKIGEGEEYFEDYAKQIEVEEIPDNCRYDEMFRDLYDFIVNKKENPYSYDHEILVQKVLMDICG